MYGADGANECDPVKLPLLKLALTHECVVSAEEAEEVCKGLSDCTFIAQTDDQAWHRRHAGERQFQHVLDPDVYAQPMRGENDTVTDDDDGTVVPNDHANKNWGHDGNGACRDALGNAPNSYSKTIPTFEGAFVQMHQSVLASHEGTRPVRPTWVRGSGSYYDMRGDRCRQWCKWADACVAYAYANDAECVLYGSGLVENERMRKAGWTYAEGRGVDDVTKTQARRSAEWLARLTCDASTRNDASQLRLVVNNESSGGKIKITNQGTCREAAKALGLIFSSGMATNYTNASGPAGCFVFDSGYTVTAETANSCEDESLVSVTKANCAQACAALPGSEFSEGAWSRNPGASSTFATATLLTVNRT